ncbi:MAG TPA: hypothetical protein VN496_12460 [Burkholderiales bacterium]|nr:hypothetical protein [Burkholderiales bacterium]
MKRRFPVVILAATTMLACTNASADTSIGLSAGTLGGGVELAHAFSERLGIRIGANGLNHDSTETYQSVNYDSQLKLATGELLFDWFPFANNFRISAGAMYNGNKLTLTGKPSPGGTYTINGRTYSAANIGTLDGSVDFSNAAPYFGLGYGRPIGKGFSLTADLGVLFQGSPRSTLTASCGPGTPAATCTQLQSDVAAEQAQLDDDLHKYQYYPVVSIGLAYTF